MKFRDENIIAATGLIIVLTLLALAMVLQMRLNDVEDKVFIERCVAAGTARFVCETAARREEGWSTEKGQHP